MPQMPGMELVFAVPEFRKPLLVTTKLQKSCETQHILVGNPILKSPNIYWLVVWNMNFMTFHDFPYIGNVIIPTDELIFFGGVGIPPTSFFGKKTISSSDLP